MGPISSTRESSNQKVSDIAAIEKGVGGITLNNPYLEIALRQELVSDRINLPAGVVDIITTYAEELPAIRQWEEVHPFAGRIVAFQANSYSINTGPK